MTEKTIQEANSEQMKERFQFILTINDNIVCQRYFRINGFKNESKNSLQLVESVHKCVEMIKEDLKYKSNTYSDFTSPQVFNNKEEMAKVISKPDFSMKVPYFVITKDEKNVYVWDGEKMAPYDGYFNLSDYITVDVEEPETKCELKFTFMDGDKEIISEVFDGNCYQRFVRTNIDLSNSKNKYKQFINGAFNPLFNQFDSSLIDEMNKGRNDLIPIIVRELCLCCSYEDKNMYDTTFVCGKKKYNFNLTASYNRMLSAMERKYKSKTEKYLKELY